MKRQDFTEVAAQLGAIKCMVLALAELHPDPPALKREFDAQATRLLEELEGHLFDQAWIDAHRLHCDLLRMDMRDDRLWMPSTSA